MHKPPIIILGAPRSGTNMLRDLLSQLRGIITWDCDEINPIWKYKNYNKTDELMPSDLTPKIKKYIINEFDSLSKNQGVILEKTCANTLRPSFVNAIFPNAKFIYIYRNGFDCAISAKKKSKRFFDLSYQLKKLKYAPLISYPFLVYEKLFLRSWGPIYNGMNDDYKSLTDLQIVAKQWMKCNEKCIKFVSKLDSHQIFYINYDQFVQNPKYNFSKILDFINIESKRLSEVKFNHVHKSSIGKGYKGLDNVEIDEISNFILAVNKKLQKL